MRPFWYHIVEFYDFSCEKELQAPFVPSFYLIYCVFLVLCVRSNPPKFLEVRPDTIKNHGYETLLIPFS